LVEVAALADLKEGVPLVVTVNGRELVLTKWQDKLYALRNVCPHMQEPFSHGTRSAEKTGRGLIKNFITGGDTIGELSLDENEPVIICPWHTWQFRLRDGKCAFDEKLRVRSYPVVADEHGRVFIDEDA
jgi:nitrite reductase (NADH) small subunit